MTISQRLAAALLKHGRLLIDSAIFMVMTDVPTNRFPGVYLVFAGRKMELDDLGDAQLTVNQIFRGDEERFLKMFKAEDRYSEACWAANEEKYVKALEETGIVIIKYAE